MRQLIRRLHDPVIACDRDLGIVTVSPGTERLVGYSLPALCGSHYSMIRAVEPDLHEQRERQVLEQGVYDGPARVFDADGEIVEMSVLVVALQRGAERRRIDGDGIAYLSHLRPVAEPWVERLLTLQEAALALRKSTRSVRRMLHDGTLVGHKIGATWRIAEGDLERVAGVRPVVPGKAVATRWTGDR